jgi:hypothetical protein
VHLVTDLNNHLDCIFEVPRIKNGNRQRIKTFIRKEALLLSKYLKIENKERSPKIQNL